MMFNTILVILLGNIALSKGICSLKKYVRGEWIILDDKHVDTKDKIKVMSHEVEINSAGKRYSYECHRGNTGYTFTLRSKDRPGFLCLEFAPIMDTAAQYGVIRRNAPAASNGMFDPSETDTCATSDSTSTVYIRRKDPGCTFPSELLGSWLLSEDPLFNENKNELNIEKSTLTLKSSEGNKKTFTCERYHVDSGMHLFALRSSHFDGDKDGVLCMRFFSLPWRSGDRHLMRVQRFNGEGSSNTSHLRNPILLVDHGEPVYLYETCEYADTVGPNAIYNAIPKSD